jgi:hydrogenase-1 operon protein HyaE
MNDTLSPLLDRLAQHGYRQIGADALDDVAVASQQLLVMLNADPQKYPEVFDNAVIVPEVLREFPAGSFEVVYADSDDSRRIAARFGIVKFPALLFLRHGAYLGVIAGLLDWPDIVAAFAAQLGAEPRRPPSVGIAVNAAPSAGGCV